MATPSTDQLSAEDLQALQHVQAQLAASGDPRASRVGQYLQSQQPKIPAPQGGFFKSVGERLQRPLNPGPLGAGGNVEQNDTSQTYDTSGQAMGAALKGAGSALASSLAHPSQLLPKWDDIKKAITPKEVDQIRSGDYSGALGTALVDFVNTLSGGFVSPESLGAKVENAANAGVRGAAQTANAVIPKAGPIVGATVGGAIGHATGIPGAGEIGAVTGGLVSKDMLKNVKVPGENLGLPTSADPMARILTKAERPNGPIRGQSGLPANSQVIPPSAEAPATATEAPTAPWKAAANTNDPAVIKQAQQSLVDAIIPPSGPTANLNKWTQMNVNFYVQKGDVEAAKQTIQKAVTRRDDLLEDKSFQEMGRENVQADESNYWKTKNALRQAAESPAVGKTEMSVEQAAQEAARQAYEQTMQQKMPAFFRQGQPSNLAVEIPSDDDLTSILQKSVEAVKKGKGIQTKP